MMEPTRRPGLWILTVVAALAAGIGGTLLFGPKAPGLPPPSLIALEKMGHLVSVKVNFADVIEFTENRAFDIPWTSWEVRYAGTKVLLVARGDCLVATDLRAARYEAIDAVNRTVTVVLPTPGVIQARVNHAPPEQGGSHVFALSNHGIEAIIPGSANRTKAIDAAMRVAQTRVEAAGKTAEVVATAKQNAELVLKSAFAALGWVASFKWQ